MQGAAPLGDGKFWVGDQPIVVVREPPPSRRSALVLGEAAVGMTVRDADVQTQARLRWRIAQGDGLEQVAFTLPGVAPDLEVTGPQIARWSRTGDRVVVELSRRERALVTVEARWSTPLAATAETTLRPAVPVLDGTFRTVQALQLARDSTHEVVPEVTAFQPLPAARLPAWAQGLVQGQATAAFTSEAAPSARVRVFQATPAPRPATLVDVARYDIATSEEGRMLMRATFSIRNDRGGFLRLTPPAGLQVVGARVGTETAKLSRESGVWLIPLARSVETLQGLLSFPVEVTLLGSDEAWDGVVDRTLSLPSVGAPVAVTRATVHLPPTYQARRPKDAAIVDRFTEGGGITYGFKAGDARVAQADELFQGAVAAWVANDFDKADALISNLEALGGDNDDIQRLKSNIDYVQRGSRGGDVAQARRVKELARARAARDVVEQQAAVELAEQQYAEGDYEQAAASYGKALKLGGKLGKIAADEDTEVAARNEELRQKLKKSNRRLAERAKPEEPALEPVIVTGEVAEVRENPRPSLPAKVVSGVERAPSTPAVTAAALSVVVPQSGDTILYQRLLLPAGAADAVPIRARPKRRNR